ncbi:MAG: D-2-hydroxyacid dehydrogenase [Pseudomonadota bacterium]
MLKLLVHEATFARLAERLKTQSAAVSPIVLHDDGRFRAADGSVLDEPVEIDIAYATPDAFFGPQVTKFFGTVMSAPTLQWFQSSAAGIEHPALKAIGQKAGLYTSSHEQAPAIAEWVLWAGLDWFQGGPARREAQASKTWGRMAFTEIGDTHWLIVGFGAIGRETARRVRGLGATVTGVRRTPGADPDADEMIQPGSILPALPAVDAVVLSCPLTPETENMAGRDFFAAMKADALFVNVGRGALVDETALLDGLAVGRPAYAALDVVREEPLPPENPIWAHPKITLTPHTSAQTMGAARRTDSLFLSNLEAFLSGGALHNLVEKADFD